MRFYLLVTLLLLSSIALAQNDFLAGYIVQQNGDTLKGFIQTRIDMSSRKCSFALTDGGAVTSYTPADIPAYGVSNVSHFRSLKLESNTPTFVEVVIDGKASLLAVEDY